jgi:hypothetical protein
VDKVCMVLSVIYEIATKGHVGELKVENDPGRGSTFTILPPIKKNIHN